MFGFNDSQTNLTDTSQSSLIIHSGTLRSNRTYHFQVEIINISNSSLTFIGNLLVEVVDENQTQIAIQCLIKNLCQPKDESQWIDPTTQLTLISTSMFRSNGQSILDRSIISQVVSSNGEN